jgi:hypothetical protein
MTDGVSWIAEWLLASLEGLWCLEFVKTGYRFCSQYFQVGLGCSYSVPSLIRAVDISHCTRIYPKVSGLSHNEIYAYNNKHSLRSNTKVYGGKITRLTHKTAIQFHLVAESCTTCSSRPPPRRPVRKLLDTPSYCIWDGWGILITSLATCLLFISTYFAVIYQTLTSRQLTQGGVEV